MTEERTELENRTPGASDPVPENQEREWPSQEAPAKDPENRPVEMPGNADVDMKTDADVAEETGSA